MWSVRGLPGSGDAVGESQRLISLRCLGVHAGEPTSPISDWRLRSWERSRRQYQDEPVRHSSGALESSLIYDDSPMAGGTTIDSGVVPERSLSLRHELEHSFRRETRRRVVHWAVAVPVLLMLLTAGFSVWFRGQYGTFAWWSAPPRIPYCGLNFVPAPAGYQSFVNRSSLGRLDEVTSVPPLFRAVFIAPESSVSVGGGQSCSGAAGDSLYFQSGSGKLIEYVYPTS